MLFILIIGSLITGFCFSYALLGYYLAKTKTDKTVSKNSKKYFIPMAISLVICIFSLGLQIYLTQPIKNPHIATYELLEANYPVSHYIVDNINGNYTFSYNKNGNPKFVNENKSNVKIIVNDSENKVVEKTTYITKDLSKFWQTFLTFNIEFGDYGPLHITTSEKTYEVFITPGSIMPKK